MDELLKQVQDSLRGIWERRWFGLLAAWIVGLGGAGILISIPDKYEASARVYVDTDSTLRPLMQGITVQPDLRQELELLSRVLINRPTVEKLITSSDLDLKVTTPKARDELVDHVMNTVGLASVDRGNNIWKISYRDPNPESAKRLVQALLSIFLESSAGNKRTDAEQAQRFLDEQIKIYENKLNEADARLKDFRLKYLGLTGEGSSDYVGQLTQLGDELARARADYQAAVQTRDALRREQQGEEPILLPDGTGGGAVNSGIVPELDARIDTLNKNLDELHRKYTDQHPDVVSTKRLIEELEKERRTEIEKRRKLGAAGMGSADSNPVYQQIKVAAANAEANVAAMGARLRDLEARYQRLKERQQLVPEIDAERSRLTRDYEINKKNYDSLVARRESAVMSKQMQSVQGIGEFRVIDPPRATPTPVSPNRLMLLPMVLVAALGAGLFVSLAISQLWPTFHDTRALRTATKRPMLGAISMLRTPRLAAQQRRSTAMFAVGLSTLVLGYAVGIGIMMVRSPIL